jgi:hypothetical protein
VHGQSVNIARAVLKFIPPIPPVNGPFCRNVGHFYRRRAPGAPSQTEFFTLPVEFVREHLDVTSSWEKVHRKPLREPIAHFRDEAGFDQIARRLGVPPPTETFV